MGYYIDFDKLSIEAYQNILESAHLPPGRMVLKERLSECFSYLKNTGIMNVRELIQLLKNKDSFTEISDIDCFKTGYLAVLLREINSIIPKPNKIADFTTISTDAIQKLENEGFKNTEQLYYYVITDEGRKELARKTGIHYDDMLKLAKLADLSRIKWVSATYAEILLEAGVNSVEEVGKADPCVLHEKINHILEEKKNYKVRIGINDVNILIESAAIVPSEIQF